MPRETIPITGAVLTWARLRSGFPLEELKATFRAIEEWEAETAQPTYPQLEQLSDKLKIPVAVFFFPEPPKVPPIRESFRTLPDAEFDQMPPSVRYMLRKASAMQLNLAEMNGGKNPSARLATRDLNFAESTPVATMASTVRRYLDVTLDQQIQWPTAEEGLEQWRDALTRVGVFVFKDAFRSDEYSGFCLYDAEFPIIYVNNSMSKTRQIFTLFHELAHLIFHTSGIDTPSNDYVGRLPNDAKRIEVLANKFAGLFLVPEQEFATALAGFPATRESAAELARRFKVSRDVIYRKFLDRNLVSQGEYEAAVAAWTQQAQQAAAAQAGGGDYYNTQIAYLGRDYINLAFSQYYQNRIDEAKLADYLNIAPKYVGTLEARLQRRRA